MNTLARSDAQEKSEVSEQPGSDNAHYVAGNPALRNVGSINPARLWQEIVRQRRAATYQEPTQQALPFPGETAEQRTLAGTWERVQLADWYQPSDHELPNASVPETPEQCGPELWDRQEQLALALDARGLYKRAGRHRECNRTWNTYGCGSCGAESYSAVATCDLRTCLSCQKRKSKELAAKTRARLDALPKPRGYRLRMITLTVRTDGSDDMRRAVKLLGKALPKLWRYRYELAGRKVPLLRFPNAGAMFAFEAGEGRGNIHCHGLYWGPWVDQKRLSAAWGELTGGSVVVDVRLARGPRAVAEVCKYVCHPWLPPHLQAALEDALQGTRRIRTYGALYGCEPDDGDTPHRACPHCGDASALELTGTRYLGETAVKLGPRKQWPFPETGPPTLH